MNALQLARFMADWMAEHAYVQSDDLTEVLVDASGGDYLDFTELAAAILRAVAAPAWDEGRRAGDRHGFAEAQFRAGSRSDLPDVGPNPYDDSSTQ